MGQGQPSIIEYTSSSIKTQFVGRSREEDKWAQATAATGLSY